MSGHNLERTLPPGDRDDAPTFDLGDAIRDTPLDQTPDVPLAPSLRANDPEAARLKKLERHASEGLKEMCAAFRLLSEHDRLAYRGAISRCALLLTEAASLARLLADPPASRAKE